MLRSTRKEVKERIHDYIMDRFDPSNYGREAEEFNTFHDTALFIWRTFDEEYRLHDPKTLRYYGSLQNAFTSWLQGLPSVFYPEYYINSAVLTVGRWLDETEAELERFNETEAEAHASKLIYREIYGELIKEWRKSNR